jgi:hypothetical protein
MLEDYGRQVVGFAGPEANPSRGPAVATADVARPVYAVAEAPWLTTENTLAVATDEATGVPQLVAKVLFAGPGATPERVRQLLADFEQSLSKPGEYQLVLEPGLDHFIYVDPANGRPFMNFGTRGERFMSLPSYLREPPGPDGKGGVPGAPQDHDWTDWAALHEGLHLFYGIPDAYVNWASRPWFAPLGYMTVDGYEDQMNGNRGAYGLPSLAEILHQNQAPRFRRGY